MAVRLPASNNDPLTVYMSPGGTEDFSRADFVYFNPATGKHLMTWHRDERHTLGEWFIWAMQPVHFGIYWGFGVKVIWAVLGLSIPTLVITGALMYWNRALRKKFRKPGRAVRHAVNAAAAAPVHSEVGLISSK
jgi:uncharacterized iron-regulated membrane protein